MRIPSHSEIQSLGRQFGVQIDNEEIDEIQEQVANNLEGLEAVTDLQPDTSVDSDIGHRTWSQPDDDPFNGLVVRCDVPPTSETSGVLAGKSVGVKDLIAVAGIPMQCGSGSMEGFVPSFDATVVERLREAGATIAAKTNLDEFAGGARGVSFFGQMQNPHDEEHIPGGSSGGSAIAVLTDQVDVALGTDTGGSVRLPANYCGIVGMKPTYGLVPNNGVVENTYTLDHVGPMTSSVEDAASVLEAIAGKDRTDPASMQAAGRDDYTAGGYVNAVASPPDLSDVELGVIEEGIGRGTADHEVNDDVVARTEAAVDALADAGATVHRVSIEHYELSGPIKYAQSYAELAAHWRDGGAPYRRGGLVDPHYQASFARNAAAASAEVNPYYRARLIAGAQLIEAHNGRHYTRALAAGEALAAEFGEASAGVDALVMPTTPSTAPTIADAKTPGYHYGRNTSPANVTGRPAITLPNGLIDELPIGLQLVGEKFDDARLLGVAAATERILE